MSTQFQLIRFDVVDQTLKPRFVGGEELPNWRQGPEILEYIRQMALEWWLVTGGSSRELIITRQASEPTTPP